MGLLIAASEILPGCKLLDSSTAECCGLLKVSPV